MKKLIYIANVRIPTEKAHGIQIMKMCEAFSDQGINVELILPRRLNKIKENSFDYYAVKKTFKITRLPTLDLITLGLGPLGFFAETLLFLISSSIYLLFKDYDILYTREEWAGLFFSNYVIEIHSLPTSSASPGFWRKRIWQKARALLVLTSFIKNDLVGASVPKNKILVLPDAVDLEKFDIKISKEEARKKLNLPQDKKIVMYVGLFDEWKGYKTALETSRLFDEDTRLVMVGGAAKEVEKLKKEFPKVMFAGYMPYVSLPEVQRAADILIIPNSVKYKISKYYTSPLKLFAHMASGRPIVSSDLPSLREILTEKEAIFFRPNDSIDLARAIKEILANPILAAQISQNAREKVQNYTWANRAQRAIDFLSV